MLNKIKSIFRSRTPPKTKVKAKFDAAQTNKDNFKHWSAADYLSADMEATAEVRQTLRMRSRYEVANNSYAKGLVQMLANDCIGTGPRLQMLSNDEDFNDEIESEFMRWAESVKLDIMLIEADRVSGDLVWLENDTSVDGISFDVWGNPVSYRVLKYHPGDLLPSTEAIHIPAEYMLHIFRQDRPGLHRGVPELTSALPLFAQLRRYKLAVLSAAEAAADFAAILYTDAPASGEADEVEPMDTIPLERNMMLTVPAGWKLSQLDPKQPTSNHAEFVKIILSEVARCVVCTYGTLAGDFSGHNYASGRLDNQIYHKSILVDRSFWETEVLNRIFEVWYREYCLINFMAIPQEKHTWFWDGFPHVDPNKEANAQATRLENNTTTLAAECAKDGKDYLAVLKQRSKELKLMKTLGIPHQAEVTNEINQNNNLEEQEIE